MERAGYVLANGAHPIAAALAKGSHAATLAIVVSVGRLLSLFSLGQLLSMQLLLMLLLFYFFFFWQMLFQFVNM